MHCIIDLHISFLKMMCVKTIKLECEKTLIANRSYESY